jgi:glycerophosphoryl diester phosphodiesterase
MKRALIAAALALAGCEDHSGGAPSIRTSIEGVLAPPNLPAFFDCLRERGATVASGHRGGLWADIPENSITAFETTVRHSPAFLEVDIAQTQDGVLVLMHDETVDRTTEGQGEIRRLSLAQLRALRLRDSDGDLVEEHPPTLREALDWAAGRTVLELDVKRGVAYEDVARELQAANATDRVVFITYSVDGASRVARVAPDAMIYTTITSATELDTLEQRGVSLSHVVAWVGADALNEALVQAIAARGVEARFGMFGGAREYETVVGRGVQILAVDDPLAAVAIFDVYDGDGGYEALQCVSAR